MTNSQQDQDSAQFLDEAVGSGAAGRDLPNTATLRGRVLSWPTLVAAAIGAVLLGFALWKIFDFEWNEVWDNIRNIHPGPAFHRAIVGGDDQPSRDFVALDTMIEQVLGEPLEEASR